jgi:prepilin-type N-terminal cleavage/methylation domain-containing protein
MRKRGYTLVELLVGLIVFAIVMAGIFVAFQSLWDSQNIAIGLSSSQAGAEQVEYKLSEMFQAATNCLATDSGCVQGTPVQNASSTGCTVYTRNSSGTLVQTVFATSGTTFQMTTAGTTTVLATNVVVTLTYYTSTTYNATAMTTYTPTSSTAANLIAVGISVVDTQGGGNTSYTTLVRLRNGP